ncbi:MAG: DUF1553 domain-containing protein [Bryobacteraceae bacterium]|nr:DUF1553 domain-containing protein [Bryobacteraceae bacterium]
MVGNALRARSVDIFRFTSFLMCPAMLLVQSANGKVSFNRDIRPIMSETCFRCHGPDKSSRMAGLRLDIREEAIKPTRTKVIPIVPGKPEESAIIDRIFSKNPAKLMPPKYAHKELSEAQKETIRRWVAEGAEYEGHWAYAPIKRPPVPALQQAKAPIRNPIDAFVQARLAKEGLTPAPEADRRTLLRRVSLDLTGLPPTPREVEEFLNDPSPDAYEKVVDRLLASPRYAEKQAMHWLDAVRYADTCGFHGDNPIPAWPYRDYVLRAFRDNKPFDEFTREQLAGDLLPNPSTGQLVASAYNRLNRTSAEGGVQPKEYLAKYAADRVRTTSAVWMGSTLGCAECHDHKFDPFTTKDFYSMKAFFADIKETGLVPDRGPRAFGTKLMLPSEEQARRLEELKRRVEAARRKLDERLLAMEEQQQQWERRVLEDYNKGLLSWQLQRPISAQAENGAVLTVYNDEPFESVYEYRGSLVSERKPGNGLLVASGPNPDNETYVVTLKPGAGTWTALGIEVIQDESLPGIRVARGSDRVVLTEVEAELTDSSGKRRKLPFALATSSTAASPDLPAMAAIDGDSKTGWGISTYGEGQNLFLALRFQETLRTEPGSVITLRLRHDSDYRQATIGRFRIALSSGEYSWPGRETTGMREPSKKHSGLPEAIVKALKLPAEKRSASQYEALLVHFAWATPELQPLYVDLVRSEAELAILEGSIPKVLVTESVEPRITRVLPRGNWMDDSGEIVEPAIPAFLGKLQTSGRATRLDLANWLVSKDNPLTARVFVNRMWRLFFGTGLSKVLDDLGSQGEWPTHPELLDWLAAEFMEPQAPGTHAWDMKHIVRTIVTSHTYRQSSAGSSEAEAKDPDNRLLARQSRLRVDAEIVRDVALSVAGLLDDRFGGPSVRPYQPDGYLAALNYPKRGYSASRGKDLYRRGLYVHWQRSFLHPSLLTFDAPTREECTINRVTSNTPLQALVLLNDPIFVEAARVFAARILKEGGSSIDKQIDWAYRGALSRPARPEEQRILADLHRASRDRFRTSPEEAKKLLAAGDAPLPQEISETELAAMTTVARAILNLHETITRN